MRSFRVFSMLSCRAHTWALTSNPNDKILVTKKNMERSILGLNRIRENKTSRLLLGLLSRVRGMYLVTEPKN